MASISNPSAVVNIGYNGFALSGYFIQDYSVQMTGDQEAVISDGRTLCYITSNPGREYSLSLLVGASANQDPPLVGQTMSITVGVTSTLPDEDSASAAALEVIVKSASVTRQTGAMRMDLVVQWHPAYDNDANPMNFDGTAYALT